MRRIILSVLFAMILLTNFISAINVVAEEIPSLNLSSSASTTDSNRGVKILPLQDFTLVNVTRFSGSTATQCQLRYDNNTNIVQSNFTGENCPINSALTSGTTYRIVITSGTSSYTLRSLSSGISYPYATTGNYVNITSGINSAGDEDTGVFYSLGNLTLDVANNLVVLNRPANDTITSNLSLIFNVTVDPTGQGNNYNITNVTYWVWYTNGTVFNSTNKILTGNSSKGFLDKSL